MNAAGLRRKLWYGRESSWSVARPSVQAGSRCARVDDAERPDTDYQLVQGRFRRQAVWVLRKPLLARAGASRVHGRGRGRFLRSLTR